MKNTDTRNYKGLIQSIDGLIGLSIFSVAFIVLISSYAEFGYSSNSSISLTSQYISKEANMQHTIYMLENSDSSLQNFEMVMEKSGYDYSIIGIKQNTISDQNSLIKRIVVVKGKMYYVWVN